MAVRLNPVAAGDYEAWFVREVERLGAVHFVLETEAMDRAQERAAEELRKMLPDGVDTPRAHVLWVDAETTDPDSTITVAGHEHAGWVFWRRTPDGSQAQLVDVLLADPGHGAQVRELIADAARAEGAAQLWMTVRPGDASSEALADRPGLTVRATNMTLLLDGPPVEDDGSVELRPMTPEQHEAFMSDEEASYAESRQAAGETPERAREVARTQIAQLVPDGLSSPGQRFWTAYAEGTPIGSLWIDDSQPRAFVYNVVVDPLQRRRGYGRAIMTAGARWCQEHGSVALGLNVFGYNEGARVLYDQLGYTVDHETRSLDL
ncbi:GNAT family N-acetyltransferase [Luteipulveratus sp. YIM 133132]|uniref:GNAT family N-acetyltransferase n=1 Tax=Luteipulveratus flavus TaxID=3031728 RepID=UPI0023B0CE83|nr:GNAT family N-acetyltransferase [Luteipulveratus sp. YIM 133132]MDE9364901.1 GNAT family N-acetyltransferase [Luteipulveratus sp. YIM 133132]